MTEQPQSWRTFWTFQADQARGRCAPILRDHYETKVEPHELEAKVSASADAVANFLGLVGECSTPTTPRPPGVEVLPRIAPGREHDRATSQGQRV